MAIRTVGDTVVGANNVTGVVADHASISDALAASSAGDTIRVIRAASVQSTTANVTLANITIEAHPDCAITDPSDAEFDAKARIDCGASEALSVDADGCTVRGIGIRASGSDAVVLTANGTNFVIVDAIVICTGASQGLRCFFANSPSAEAFNVAMWGDGTLCIRNTGTFTGYGLSMYQPTGGRCVLAKAGGTTTINSSIAQGAGDGFTDEGSALFGDYNVSQDATAPGANSLLSQSGAFTNTSSGSEDLTLTSTTAYDIVNRSGYPTETDADIAGTARPATGADAGAWQNPAAGSARGIPFGSRGTAFNGGRALTGVIR